MEQMTSICDMVGQYTQKKEDEKRIVEVQAAKYRYWKIPFATMMTRTIPLQSHPIGQTFKEHSEIVVDFNDYPTSSDDDSPYGEHIDYVDASPPDAEIVNSEVVEIVIPEVRGVDTNILLTIKDDILGEKLLNVNLLIDNIKALKDNPTPSSDFVTKSPSIFPNSFLEKINTFDNSLTESETFRFNLEEISS
ncbi:hypothetical protein Tco_0126154, partial [Tanacetum coccineum]